VAQSPGYSFAAAVQEPILRGLARTMGEEDADQVLAGWAAWLLFLIEIFFTCESCS
jgi:hypothetical protein